MRAKRAQTGFSALASFLLQDAPVRLQAVRLSLLGGVMLSVSCLSPQSIEVTPAKPRQAPVIDLAGVTPEAPVCVDKDHPVNSFSLTVQSPDGLGLEARWFLDYDENNSATQDRLWDQPLTPASDVPAAGPTVFSVELGIDHTKLLQNPGIHGLEVVIATQFSSDQNAKPFNRALAPGAFATSYKWVVDTSGTCQ